MKGSVNIRFTACEGDPEMGVGAAAEAQQQP